MSRILLTSQKLILSKPGFDAETASFGQQLFNSDFSQLLEYGRYTHYSPSGWVQNSIGGADGRKHWLINYDVGFPKTFAGVPLVYMLVTFGSSGGYWDNKTFANSGLGAFYYENGQFGESYAEAISLSVQVHANKFSVAAQSQQYGGPIGFAIKYRLMEQTN